MKRLSSFMVLDIDGGDRVSFTFNEINPDTGELISQNNKQSFFAVDKGLLEHINAIREFLRTNKLEV